MQWSPYEDGGHPFPPVEPSPPPPSTGWGLAGFVLVALVALVLTAALAIALATPLAAFPTLGDLP